MAEQLKDRLVHGELKSGQVFFIKDIQKGITVQTKTDTNMNLA